MVNCYIVEIDDNCISLENVKGGYLVVWYLLDIGYIDIVYIVGLLFKVDGINWLMGYK